MNSLKTQFHFFQFWHQLCGEKKSFQKHRLLFSYVFPNIFSQWKICRNFYIAQQAFFYLIFLMCYCCCHLEIIFVYFLYTSCEGASIKDVCSQRKTWPVMPLWQNVILWGNKERLQHSFPSSSHFIAQVKMKYISSVAFTQGLLWHHKQKQLCSNLTSPQR